MKRVKDCLKNFRERWSVLSYERNRMDDLKSYIDSLYSIFAEKIREIQMCEEQIHKTERAIIIRRIRAIFGFFSVNNKRVKDFKETLFDRLFSVVSAIRIVLLCFSARF